MKYLKRSAVRAYIKGRNKRVNMVALVMLDQKVERLLNAACSTHNGGKKTIDEAVMTHVL